MKTLEQEAEEYSRNEWEDLYSQIGITGAERGWETKDDFIAGANSKWVQAEKIKAQIEILELHIEHPTKPGYKRHDVLDRIKSLKVQLKQLEDETKI